MRKDCKNAIKRTLYALKTDGLQYDLYEDILYICKHGLHHDAEHKYEYKVYTDYVKTVALKEVNDDKEHADTWRALYWETIKLETFHFFESYLYYMERKRPYEKRFYEPRQKTLKLVVEDLQKIEDSDTKRFYGLSLPARSGKSTLILFFITWIVLRHPYSHNAIGTHSGILARHFYKELMDLFATEEYTFEELYKDFHPELQFIVDKSADEFTISFVQKGDFPTITCRGIDGTWTGAVDISADGYLCVDDLVRDRTHSLSPKRMNDTFAEYLNKMVDRLNDGAKQLMIGTLWNILDPLMRLEEMYQNDDRYVFRRIPALNENDESNFDYEVKGFSTAYYRDMRDRMVRAGNEPEWMAKYQQAPYNREGLLFPNDELRFFNGILPQDHRFKYIVVCDPAFGGGDNVSMPIGLQDEDTNWIYIIDWYFSSAGVKITIPEVCNYIVKYGILDVTFEKNNGGQLFAQQVQEELEKRGYMCSCSTKPAPNNVSKEDKIKSCEGRIKTMVVFLDGTKHDKEAMAAQEMTYYERTPQYERALAQMNMFVAIGKNDHDDAPDSIAQLCIKAFGDLNSMAEVEAISRSVIGF